MLYIVGFWVIKNLYVLAPPTICPVARDSLLPSILIFIITILLLSADFYNLKNIAGRRLVGLRWWNEVNPSTGETTMVFESIETTSDPNSQGRKVNATDRR